MIETSTPSSEEYRMTLTLLGFSLEDALSHRGLSESVSDEALELFYDTICRSFGIPNKDGNNNEEDCLIKALLDEFEERKAQSSSVTLEGLMCSSDDEFIGGIVLKVNTMGVLTEGDSGPLFRSNDPRLRITHILA